MPGTMLVVGAHMDDCENGAGGVMLDAISRGWRVVTVTVVGDFTTWEPTVGREEQVVKDLTDLADSFGYEKRFLDYAYHQVAPDIELKNRLAVIYDELRPEIGLVHWHDDHWPDHSAVGIAAKDALIFAHGLSGNLASPRCPRVLAYSATPHQTINFRPDVYHNITHVMSDYMRLIIGTDACLSGRPQSEINRNTISWGLGAAQRLGTIECSYHGWTKLAECVVWGDESQVVPFAQGLRHLWGPRDGRPLLEQD